MHNNNSIAPSVRSKPFAKRYNLVIGLFLSTLIIGLVVTSFGIFFKPVSADFGWTRAETSGAFSLSTIMSGLAGIVAGRLSDRFSPRLVILICGIIAGVAYLLLAQMTSLWQLYFYYGILVGAGMANIVPASSIVSKCFQNKRGRMTGIALSGAAFSSIFVPYLATWLIDRYDWRTSFSVIGAFCLLILIISGFFLLRSGADSIHPDERLSQTKDQNPVKSKNLKEVLGSWTFWCVALIYFCFHFSLSVVMVHIVPYATDLGISPVLAASVLMIANGTNVVGSFCLGSINDKIGGKKSLILGLAILGIGSILIIISNSFWLLCLFAIIFGFAWGGVGSMRSVIVAELFGLGSHGVLVGAIMLFALIGGTLSPILSGYIFDVTGQYRLAFFLLCGVSIAGFIFSLFLLRRSQQC